MRETFFLHDIEDFLFRRGDTLREPRFRTPTGGLEQFDLVIANPPFSLNPWGRDVWADDPFGRSRFGIPPATKGDYAFVEHMLTVMRPETGRLAVVMPQRVLFRTGAEREIRQNILAAGLLEAIIALPPNLFYNTSLPACVLVCRAEISQQRREHVLFIDASLRFVKAGARNVMQADDIETVVAAYRSGNDPDGEGGLAVRLVPLSEIESNDWDLSVARYLAGAETDAVEVSFALAEYVDAREELREAEDRLDDRLREAGFLV